jgi:hypothetical protein
VKTSTKLIYLINATLLLELCTFFVSEINLAVASIGIFKNLLLYSFCLMWALNSKISKLTSIFPHLGLLMVASSLVASLFADLFDNINLDFFRQAIKFSIIFFMIPVALDKRLKVDLPMFLKCVNFWVVLIFIFQIIIFSTGNVSGASYGDFRFGYKSFFYSVNEFAIILSLFMLFYIGLVDGYKSNWVYFVLVVISAVLSGAKVAYLFSLIFLLLMLRKYWVIKLNILEKILSSVVLVIFINYVFLFEIFTFSIPAFSWFAYSLENSDWFTVFMSGRNVMLHERMPLYLDGMHLINHLFGGVNLNASAFIEGAIEMDFFDLYLTFGLFGIISFVILIVNFFGVINAFYPKIIMTVLVAISATSGHVLYSPLIILLFVVIANVYNSSLNKLDEI